MRHEDAGVGAQALIAGVCQRWRHAGYRPVENPVEEQWETISEEPKIGMAWYLFGRAAPKNAECAGLVDTALSFKSFRTVLGRALF